MLIFFFLLEQTICFTFCFKSFSNRSHLFPFFHYFLTSFNFFSFPKIWKKNSIDSNELKNLFWQQQITISISKHIKTCFNFHNTKAHLFKSVKKKAQWIQRSRKAFQQQIPFISWNRHIKIWYSTHFNFQNFKCSSFFLLKQTICFAFCFKSFSNNNSILFPFFHYFLTSFNFSFPKFKCSFFFCWNKQFVLRFVSNHFQIEAIYFLFFIIS